MTLKDQIRDEFDAADDKIAYLNDLREWMHGELSPQQGEPVDFVRWVPVDQIRANDYNPNRVAENEMKLLHTSISHDGYTQPVVVIWDEETETYVIVDGFHRYLVLKNYKDIDGRTGGLLPVVVIEKDVNDRMASTVRHNRARGKHNVTGMGSMVFEMLNNGWGDAEVCAELGLEADELVRLKHVTGFSKLFEDVKYRRAWETRKQITLRKEYRDNENGEAQGQQDQAILEQPSEKRVRHRSRKV